MMLRTPSHIGYGFVLSLPVADYKFLDDTAALIGKCHGIRHRRRKQHTPSPMQI